jgi:hypothetical protein
MRAASGAPALRAAACACLLLCAGCRSRTLPPAPAALTTGIAIYSNINYDGDSAHVVADIPDLRRITAGACAEIDTRDDPEFTAGSHTWTNCISSFGVAPGWRAIFFADPGFTGAEYEATSSLRDLRRVPGPCIGTMNDCISSIRVVPPA